MPDNEYDNFLMQYNGLPPALIVGLGGTGKKVVTRLKARFYEQFKKVPDTVRLMALDIDVKEDPYMLGEQEISLLPDEEMMDLGDVPAGDIIQEIKRNRYPEVRDWFNPNVPLQEANLRRGGQQNRQLGRLALFWNIRARNLYRALESTVHYLKQQGLVNKAGNVSRERSTDLVIYMVGSLAGGTGSGIMIDTAYLLRRIANSIGILDSTSVVGIFVMPRPFDRVRQEAIQPNTLAALQELDYFMSCPVEARRFDSIRYIEGSPVNKVDCTERPFNVCYLIDSVNSRGEMLLSIEQLWSMIVDGMFLLSASQIGEMAWSNINNLSQKFVGTRVFSSFGIASLVFPANQIQHICAAKVGAEVILKLLRPLYREGEDELVREFDLYISRFPLSYKRIVNGLSVNEEGKKVYSNLLENELLTAARLEAIPKDQWYITVVRIVDDLIANEEMIMREKIEENRINNLNIRDILMELNCKVKDLVNDPAYGLNYAVGYIEKFDDYLNKLKEDVERKISFDDKSRNAVQKRRILSRAYFDQEVIQSKRFLRQANPKGAREAYLRDSNDFLNYTRSLYLHINAKRLLIELSEKVSLLLDQLNQFVENLTYVHDVYLPRKKKAYHDEIEKIHDTRRNVIICALDRDIDALYEKYKEKAPLLVMRSVLVESMLQGGEGVYGLISAKGEEIGDKIYQFALQSVKDILEIKLETILQEREHDREHPIDKSQWQRELHANADVFWKYTEAGMARDDIATEFLVTGVEDARSTIYKFLGARELNFCSTGDPHRITVLKMKHALDYRYTKQYSEFRHNYRKAILQGYPLHIFPEFSAVGEREKNIFIQGLVYGFITCREPIFYCTGADGNLVQLNKTGQNLSDVLWNFARERRGKLVEFVESEIEKKLYGPTVTDDERCTFFEEAREKVGDLNLVKEETDADSQFLAMELEEALETHLKSIAKKLRIVY